MALPDAPSNSADQFDDELDTGDDGGKDGALPEPQAPAINLTSEQAADAGIVDPAPGDQFTVKITINGTGEGITGDILPGSAVKEGGPTGKPRIGKQMVKGPADLGMGAEDGFSPAPSIT